jgi:hypothetical protein
VDFTREPIIETIITPREGHRLVIRSSKNMEQEEYFVDAVEVVCFGKAFFFRSIERPKPFLVPVNDYEVLEVREQRLVLKTALAEGSVKIAGGREANHHRPAREEGRREPKRDMHAAPDTLSGEEASPEMRPTPNESRQDRRRGDRRRGGGGNNNNFRRRRGGKDEIVHEEFRSAAADGSADANTTTPLAATGAAALRSVEQTTISPIEEKVHKSAASAEDDAPAQTTFLRSVLPPPTTLIRDDLERLRTNEAYRGAFFVRENKEDAEDDNDVALEDMHGGDPMEFHVHSSYEEKGVSFEEEEPFLFSSSHEKEAGRDGPGDIL